MRAMAVLLAVVAALAATTAGFIGGMTVERQLRVAEAAAMAPTPIAAAGTPDVGPLGPFTRATLAVRCYEAAGRAGVQPMQSTALLRECLKYVDGLP